MAHKILSTFDKKCERKRYLRTKLDVEKAYYRLDLDFITKCFNYLGFLIDGLVG